MRKFPKTSAGLQRVAAHWGDVLIREGFIGRHDLFCVCGCSEFAHYYGPRTHPKGHAIAGQLHGGRCLGVGCKGCARFDAVELAEESRVWTDPAGDRHLLADRLDHIRIQLPDDDRDPVTVEQWVAFLSQIEGRDPKAGGGSKGRRVRDTRGPSVDQLREQRRQQMAEDDLHRPTRQTSLRAPVEDLETLKRHGITTREAVRVVAEAARKRENRTQTLQEVGPDTK